MQGRGRVPEPAAQRRPMGPGRQRVTVSARMSEAQLSAMGQETCGGPRKSPADREIAMSETGYPVRWLGTGHGAGIRARSWEVASRAGIPALTLPVRGALRLRSHALISCACVATRANGVQRGRMRGTRANGWDAGTRGRRHPPAAARIRGKSGDSFALVPPSAYTRVRRLWIARSDAPRIIPGASAGGVGGRIGQWRNWQRTGLQNRRLWVRVPPALRFGGSRSAAFEQ